MNLTASYPEGELKKSIMVDVEGPEPSVGMDTLMMIFLIIVVVMFVVLLVILYREMKMHTKILSRDLSPIKSQVSAPGGSERRGSGFMDEIAGMFREAHDLVERGSMEGAHALYRRLHSMYEESVHFMSEEEAEIFHSHLSSLYSRLSG